MLSVSFAALCEDDVVEAAAGGTGLGVGVDGHLPRVPWHLLGGGLGPGDADDDGGWHPAWGPGGGPVSTCPTSLLLLDGEPS